MSPALSSCCTGGHSANNATYIDNNTRLKTYPGDFLSRFHHAAQGVDVDLARVHITVEGTDLFKARPVSALAL